MNWVWNLPGATAFVPFSCCASLGFDVDGAASAKLFFIFLLGKHMAKFGWERGVGCWDQSTLVVAVLTYGSI